jgi:hypothetical protein
MVCASRITGMRDSNNPALNLIAASWVSAATASPE